jgi:hypothetical protein
MQWSTSPLASFKGHHDCIKSDVDDQTPSAGKGSPDPVGRCALAPLAWFLSQRISYMLVPWACATGRQFALPFVTLAMLLPVGTGRRQGLA